MSRARRRPSVSTKWCVASVAWFLRDLLCLPAFEGCTFMARTLYQVLVLMCIVFFVAEMFGRITAWVVVPLLLFECLASDSLA